MTRWTKETALRELVSLCNQIDALAQSYPFSSEHTRWRTNVLRLLEGVFGRGSRYSLGFGSFTWCFHGSTFVNLSRQNPDDVMRNRNQQAYHQQLETAHGLLCAAIDDLEQAPTIGSVYEGKDREQALRYALKAVIVSVIFIPLGIGAWLLPNDWVSVFKSPVLARLGICSAALSAWVACLLGEKWMKIAAIVALVISILSLFAGLMKALL
jgi:hypothetical protein